RSLYVPVQLASPRFKSSGTTLEAMLAATDTNTILLDPPMLEFLDEALDPRNPAHEFGITAKGLRGYLAAPSERHVGLAAPPYGYFSFPSPRPAPRQASTAP